MDCATRGAGRPERGWPPRAQRAGASRDTLFLTPAFHSIIELRHKSDTGFGVQGGGVGVNGGVWVFPATDDGAAAIPSTNEFSASTPWAGVLDPVTKAPSRSGEYQYPFDSAKTSGANSVLRYICNGAGGWGDPLEREPDRVRVDVRDEYVTIDGAARLYGVVIVGDPHEDPEGVRVDVEATRALREHMREERQET